MSRARNQALGNLFVHAFLRKTLQVNRRAHSLRDGKFGQINRVKGKIKPAALRNPHGVFHCTRILPEKQAHFRGVLQVELVVFKADRSAVRDHVSGLDTEQDCLRIRVLPPQIVAVVGGNQRNAALFSDPDELRQKLALFRKTVILQFHIEVVRAR